MNMPPEDNNPINLGNDGELQSRKFCTVCGGVSDSDAHFCQHCGASFKRGAPRTDQVSSDFSPIHEIPSAAPKLPAPRNVTPNDPSYFAPLPTADYQVGAFLGKLAAQIVISMNEALGPQATALVFIMLFICIGLATVSPRYSPPIYPTPIRNVVQPTISRPISTPTLIPAAKPILDSSHSQIYKAPDIYWSKESPATGADTACLDRLANDPGRMVVGVGSVYVRRQNFITALQVMSADGTIGCPLITEIYTHHIKSVSWMSDEQLIFAGDSYPPSTIGAYHRSLIFVINTDGTALRQVTVSFAVSLTGVERWYLIGVSPDGKTLAFLDKAPDSTDHWNIYLLDLDGTNFRSIGGSPIGVADPQHFKWSPDGKSVLFDMLVGSDCKLFIVELNDSTQKEILLPAHCVDYEWSPNGQLIAVLSNSGSQTPIQPHVTVVNRDGTVSDSPKIPDDKLPDLDTGISWSSDGEALLYDHCTLVNAVCTWNLYRIAIHGSEPELLQTGPNPIIPLAIHKSYVKPDSPEPQTF